MEEQSVSIRISLKAYQELVLKKITVGLPITVQIDKLLKVKHAKKPSKTNINSR